MWTQLKTSWHVKLAIGEAYLIHETFINERSPSGTCILFVND